MIAFDEGDYFFDNKEYLEGIVRELLERNVSFEILKFPRFKALNFRWNWMFHKAYLDEFTFFFQVNDDAILHKISNLISIDEFSLLSGPFDSSLPHIFTQALVRIKPHFEYTNGTLYLTEYINWGGDVWLTKLYKSSSRFVGNVTNARLHSRKPRYQPCRNYIS